MMLIRKLAHRTGEYNLLSAGQGTGFVFRNINLHEATYHHLIRFPFRAGTAQLTRWCR